MLLYIRKSREVSIEKMRQVAIRDKGYKWEIYSGSMSFEQVMEFASSHRFDQTTEQLSQTKMMRISITDEKRTGQKEFKEYDMANISKATFGMYGGPKKKVKIQFENSMCGVFLDRFGKDIIFRPVDENHSEFYVDVNISRHFFGWLFGMGSKVKLVGPDEVVDQLREYVAEYMKSMK